MLDLVWNLSVSSFLSVLLGPRENDVKHIIKIMCIFVSVTVVFVACKAPSL